MNYSGKTYLDLNMKFSEERTRYLFPREISEISFENPQETPIRVCF